MGEIDAGKVQRQESQVAAAAYALSDQWVQPDRTGYVDLRLYISGLTEPNLSQDPYNNIVRTTIEAMAAVMGVCDKLTYTYIHTYIHINISI